MVVNEAQKYLELVHTIPAQHLGPHRRFENPAVDAKPIRELAPSVTAAVKQIDNQTFEAPSPWHAAAWMQDVAALVGQVAEVDGGTGLRSPFSPKYGAPVFRGQRDPQWGLVPTLLREPRNSLDRQALEFFIKGLSELFEIVAEDTRMNGPYVHMAAAQHYEMKTPLLDFTADPRVAVFFANQKAQPERDKQVVVYGIPFISLINLGGAVVFPPPWVKRLYAQRGLFLDFSQLPSILDLRDYCFRILFPTDDRYGPSMFPKGSEALLPPDPWYEKAIKWARGTVQADDPPQSAQASAEKLRRECGEPAFMYESLLPATAEESMKGFVDMCEWLALKVVKGTLTYDCNTIVPMSRNNEPLFSNHVGTYKLLIKVFQGDDEEALRQDRIFAAMEAVTKCLEEEGL